MEPIKFEDERLRAEGIERKLSTYEADKLSGISGWLIKQGIVRTRRSAEILLLLVAALCIAIGGYIILKPEQKQEIPSNARLINVPGKPPRLEYIR